jgi:hypothetical protein
MQKFSSRLNTYFKRHVGFRSKRAFQAVFKAAGEIETTQKKTGLSWMKETLNFSL